MEIKDIKECAEYLKDKVGIIIILLSGIILCGTTSICIFNFKLFLELSIEKILLLSCIISLPTYLMFLWLVGDKAYFKMNDIYLFCMEENILTFLLAFLVKTIFVKNMDINMDINMFIATIFAIATTINTFSSRIYLIFLPTKRTYILMLKKLRKKNPKKYQEIIDELNKEKNV